MTAWLIERKRSYSGPSDPGGPIWRIQHICGARFDINAGGGPTRGLDPAVASVLCPRCDNWFRLSGVQEGPPPVQPSETRVNPPTQWADSVPRDRALAVALALVNMAEILGPTSNSSVVLAQAAAASVLAEDFLREYGGGGVSSEEAVKR